MIHSRHSVSSPPSNGSFARRTTGAWNDPPMVSPRVPASAPNPIMPTAISTQPSVAPPRDETPPMIPTARIATPPVPTTSASAPVPPAGSRIIEIIIICRVYHFLVGPVDPSKIPANLQPIHKILSTWIMQCQERCLPMQKRLVEDSARRMQHLFHQMTNQQCSSEVVQLLQEICGGRMLACLFYFI